MESFVGLILAKADSGRLPNKNILDFNGRAMFMTNLKKCLEVFTEVYVTSDDDWILGKAELEGAKIIKRGKDLCGDTPNIPVYRHAVMNMKTRPRGIIAVQANSPTVEKNLIVLAKKIMEMGIPELMTCHPDRKIYGSIWAMTLDRLNEYQDFYHPNPEVLIVDNSVDIHTKEDYHQAICQSKSEKKF